MPNPAKIFRLLTIALGALTIVVPSGAADPANAGSGASVLNVLGRVRNTDGDPLDSVHVLVDQEGEPIDSLWADARGRFAMTLDIGGFYGVKLSRRGYIVKRFVVDARAEDPSSVVTGPFSADVELRPEADLAEVDISELDMPYAFVKYAPEEHAFVVDEAYIIEMKKVEAALMLSAARARKRGKP